MSERKGGPAAADEAAGPGSPGATGPEEERAPATPILTVRVGAARFGLPVERVREVLRPPGVSRVPLQDPRIRGLVSVRGAVLPVLDLGARLLGRPVTDPGRLAVVETDAGDAVALLVDELLDLTELPVSDETAPPEVAHSLPPGLAARTAVSARGSLVTLLDLDRVLDLDERGEEG